MKAKDINQSGWYWVWHIYDWRMVYLRINDWTCQEKVILEKVAFGYEPLVNADIEVVGPLAPPNKKHKSMICLVNC